MPIFTIETSYALPVFRHASYRAARIADACRQALDDQDWSGGKQDFDNSGAVHVSGIWRGRDAAYRGRACAVPPMFHDTQRCEAGRLRHLLALLKTHAPPGDAEAQAAIATAEALLATPVRPR